MFLTFIIALAAVSVIGAESTTPAIFTQNKTDDRHTFSSFTITDVKNSNVIAPQPPADGSRMKREDETSPTTDTSSSTTTETASDSNPPNRSSDTAQQQGQLPDTTSTRQPAGRRAQFQDRGQPRPAAYGQYPSTTERSVQRYPYPTPSRQDQQYNRYPTSRPVGAAAGGYTTSNSRYPPRQPVSGDSRYPQQPQVGSDDRGRDRYPQQSSPHIALEMEVLRFSNERGVLANNQPCANGHGDECSYELTGTLETGASRGRSLTGVKGEILTTPPKSDSVDILMKSRKTLCNTNNAAQPVTLRVEVKTADPTRRRPVRQSDTETTTTDSADTMATQAYSADEDALNRVQQPSQSDAEDQYSRDRYAVDQPSLQGRGSDRDAIRQPVGGSTAPGQLVNIFECVINLSSAAQQLAHTGQWQTGTCRAQYPNNQMELAFRYNAYGIDASECDRTDGPLTWTPMNLSG